MEIHSIGYHHAHDRNFVIDRPDGIGQSWLFLVFVTKAVVRQNGEDVIIRPQSVILYSNDSPEYYRACEEEYVDDWFHFTIEPCDLVLFKELDIPFNQVLYLGDATEISSIIRAMTYEFQTAGLYSADLVVLNLNIMFFKLSRLIHTSIRSEADNPSPYHSEMVDLHNRIYNSICTITSVSELSKEFSMSKSAIQHNYKKLFGVSIMDDILNSRLVCCKRLLASTMLPLKEVAERSGYNSEFHLMRQFKSQTGMTPSQYRKKCK